jgi:zinc transporter, ZIP family
MDAETLIWIFASGLATGLGGLGLLLFGSPRTVALDAMLGFTAGVMLAATFFSLLVPALDRGTLLEVLTGFALGAALLALLDRFIPHAHARLRERGRPMAIEIADAERRSTMLLAALAIHNVPEGMAVGIAFAAGGPELGIPIALAIGIQNVPEGFAAAAPLLTTGIRRRNAAAIGAMTGWVEPPAALAAYGAVEFAGGLLAAGLAFAAGAMLYVIVDELIPESQRRGNERAATLAATVGFMLMMALDTALG